jgi:hypothetical protein
VRMDAPPPPAARDDELTAYSGARMHACTWAACRVRGARALQATSNAMLADALATESFGIPSVPAMAWGPRPSVDPASYLRPGDGGGGEAPAGAAVAERQATRKAVQARGGRITASASPF